MAKKGRARRFREARELKQGYDDGLFADSGRSLADADDDNDKEDEVDKYDDDPWSDAETEDGYDWDPDRQVDR